MGRLLISSRQSPSSYFCPEKLRQGREVTGTSASGTRVLPVLPPSCPLQFGPVRSLSLLLPSDVQRAWAAGVLAELL